MTNIISQKQKNAFWWLAISVDYDYERITIADHELTENHLTLWLEDKMDFKNTLDECLQISIRSNKFGAIIRENLLNSYIGTRVNKSGEAVDTRIEVCKPLLWYKSATHPEQEKARLMALNEVINELNQEVVQ